MSATRQMDSDEEKACLEFLRATRMALDQMIRVMQKGSEENVRSGLAGCLERGCTVRIQTDLTTENAGIALQILMPDGSTLNPFRWDAPALQASDLN